MNIKQIVQQNKELQQRVLELESGALVADLRRQVEEYRKRHNKVFMSMLLCNSQDRRIELFLEECQGSIEGQSYLDVSYLDSEENKQILEIRLGEDNVLRVHSNYAVTKPEGES
jgi:hypothetical protein